MAKSAIFVDCFAGRRAFADWFALSAEKSIGSQTTPRRAEALGPIGRPIIRDFEPLNQADIVFLESTYGDRDHRSYSDTVAEFEDLVKQAAESRGRILVPTFAIGGAQQILYHLAFMFCRDVVRPFHVYLDSPMAIEASKEMVTHSELFDEELLEWKNRGLLPLDKLGFMRASQLAIRKAYPF